MLRFNELIFSLIRHPVKAVVIWADVQPSAPGEARAPVCISYTSKVVNAPSKDCMIIFTGEEGKEKVQLG